MKNNYYLFLSVLGLLIAGIATKVHAATQEITGVLYQKNYSYSIPKNFENMQPQDCTYKNLRNPASAFHACELIKKYCKKDVQAGAEICELAKIGIATGYNKYLITDFLRQQDLSPKYIAEVLQSKVGPLLLTDLVSIQYSKYANDPFEYTPLITDAKVIKMEDAFPGINCVSLADKNGKYFFGFYVGYDEEVLSAKRTLERNFRINECKLADTNCVETWAMMTGSTSLIHKAKLTNLYYEKFGKEKYDHLADNSSEVRIEIDGKLKPEQLPFVDTTASSDIYKSLAKNASTKTNATMLWTDTRVGKSTKQELKGSERLYCYRVQQR